MVATLEPHPDTSQYFLCRIQHNYKKSYVPMTFRATIFRIPAGQDSPKQYPEIADEALSSEFVWYNDERDFAVAPKDSDYAVENLIVGNQQFNLARAAYADRLIFSCKLPGFTGHLPYISFEFKFPIERESALSLTAEFASRRGSITFDYSKLVNELDVTTFPKIGLHRNPIDLSRKPAGVYRYEYGDWVLPKDGCVVAWWTKKHD